MFAAVFQQIDEFGPVSELRRFALLLEDTLDGKSLLLGIREAVLLLKPEAHALDLFV